MNGARIVRRDASLRFALLTWPTVRVVVAVRIPFSVSLFNYLDNYLHIYEQ